MGDAKKRTENGVVPFFQIYLFVERATAGFSFIPRLIPRFTDTKRERKPWPSITNLSAYSVGGSSLINSAHFIVTITGFPVCGI